MKSPRPLLLAAVLGAAATAFAQTRPAPPAPPASAPAIGYPTVAAALQALQARDGESTIVTHSDDGWVIVNEPMASAQWSFTPKTHAAYPAVVRRIIRRSPDGDVAMDTASICEAPAAACAGLLKEFEALDERVLESARARAPRRPPMPPRPIPPAPPASAP
ncbi:MAG: hypothetical protein JSR59_05995 [Proteobacteria bacterium]|nr:hypothetical protein [Pseudomonadota bacterium]